MLTDGSQVTNLSHLEDASATGNFIADVKNKIAHMKSLELKMIEAEANYKEAKHVYEDYKATTVVAAFTSAGIEQIQDESGNFIKLESKYYLNPNKNDEVRMVISAWLKAHDGAHLLKHEGKVSSEQFSKLDNAGIPYADKIDVNTNSLKSHILDLLGYKKGSMARIALTDIPECMHFVAIQEVVTG